MNINLNFIEDFTRFTHSFLNTEINYVMKYTK